MITFYLGIDVAKAKLGCALLMPDGKCKAKVFKNTREGFGALKRWLLQHGVAMPQVCMEATGTYWEPVAENLVDAGFTVSVVNPAQSKALGTSRAVGTKTDKVDARLIAHFCRAMQPAPWTAP